MTDEFIEEDFTSEVFDNGTRELTLHGFAIPMAANLRTALYRMAAEDYTRPITVYLNSAGGDVFEAISAADAIHATRQRMNAPIIGSVTAQAMSSAAYLLQCFDHRVITEHSVLMVHGIESTFHNVDSLSLEEQVFWHGHCASVFVDAFSARSKWSKKKWEEILADSHPLFIPAREALDVGLVDEVLPIWKPQKKRR